MKKLLISGILIVAVLLTLIFSCQKSLTSSKPLPLSASELSYPDSIYTIRSSGGVVIRGYSTLNTTTQLIRRIDIYLVGGGGCFL